MTRPFQPPEGFRLELLPARSDTLSRALERGAGWIAAADGEETLEFSVAVAPACPPERARSLAVAAARFAADAIGGGAGIHWPNNIMLTGERVCAIRCRARGEVMAFRFTVERRLLPEAGEEAAARLVRAIVSSLAEAAAGCPDNLPALLQAYCGKCETLMKFVDVTYRGMPLYGFAFAVDRHGGLMVMTQESHTVVTVYSGEARLAENEPESPEMPHSPHI